jgi:hypothetical protein
VARVTNAAQVDFRFCDPARQFLAPPFEKVYFFGFVMPIRTYWLLHP